MSKLNCVAIPLLQNEPWKFLNTLIVYSLLILSSKADVEAEFGSSNNNNPIPIFNDSVLKQIEEGVLCDHQQNINQPGRKSTEDFIKEGGFSSASHWIQTEDGYNLLVHQIVPLKPKPEPLEEGNRCCLISHGYLTASDSFFFQPRVENSLPFLLTLAGCVVYLPNFRGNCYSRGHRSLNTSNPAYWNFTYHELGYYDLATSIDFVLDHGNCKGGKLTFIGHSLASTAYFVLMSSRPEYNEKIDYAVQIAPSAYVGNIISPIARALSLGFKSPGRMSNISASFLAGPTFEFFPCLPIRNRLLSAFCKINPFVCSNLPFGLFGYNYCQLQLGMLPQLSLQTPCSSSVFVDIQYLQQIHTHTFCQLNWGERENLVRYGMTSPPCYNLTKVTSNNRFYYSCNDWLCTCPDVFKLAKELPNVTLHEIQYKLWNHMDPLTAIDALPLLYCPILQWIGFTNLNKCKDAHNYKPMCHISINP